MHSSEKETRNPIELIFFLRPRAIFISISPWSFAQSETIRYSFHALQVRRKQIMQWNPFSPQTARNLQRNVSAYYNISEVIEMGKMASMFFNGTGERFA